MPKTKKKIARQSFVTQVSRSLSETPNKVKSTRLMFFTKGMLAVVFGLLLLLAQSWIAVYMTCVFAGFAVINGLIMIASALMSEKINKSFLVTGVLLGGLIIVVGVTPLVFPALLTPVISGLIVLAISLDSLFTMASMLFLVKTAGAKWWAVVAGLISIVFVIGFVTHYNYSSVTLWLEAYLLAQGVFYSLTPLVFAQVGVENK